MSLVSQGQYVYCSQSKGLVCLLYLITTHVPPYRLPLVKRVRLDLTSEDLLPLKTLWGVNLILLSVSGVRYTVKLVETNQSSIKEWKLYSHYESNILSGPVGHFFTHIL